MLHGFCVSLLGASMPHVPFLGARKTVFSTCVHGLRAYHALNQYRIRHEDMRCKSLVLAPLRLFGLEQFRLLQRSSMAQFDPVDFNCTTARAALLPTTVDLAGHRIKKQAQPFAAPVFFYRYSQAAVISCVVGDFPVPLSTPTIASPRGHHASLSRP